MRETTLPLRSRTIPLGIRSKLWRPVDHSILGLAHLEKHCSTEDVLWERG
jgi:hypothetical protein